MVEASTVVATHLNHLISQHAAELFGRQEAQQLLDRVAREMPKLTEDPFPASSRSPHCIKCCKICSMKSADSRYAHYSRNAGGTCAHPKRST
ncbi:hypothetical protein FA039_14665 [Escherichia coli]|nr:hypothetical protein [Escherichia coli]